VDLPGIAEVADAPSATWRAGDAWLSGGTWLFSEPQPDLTRLLDLRAFDWPALQPSADGLEIAATCTLAELSRFREPRWPAVPLFGQCCHALLGSFKVWNVATVGGNVCMSLPAGPMTSLTAALDGVCTIWAPRGGPGDFEARQVPVTETGDFEARQVPVTETGDFESRQVPVTEFVTGVHRNVLAPGELLRSIRLPAAALACTTSFRQISLAPAGRSGALVIGRRSPADGSVVITVTASTVVPMQLRFAGPPTADEVQAAIGAAQPRYHDDVHGLPAWREAMTRKLALEIAAELADDGARGPR
jgi:CO/xanthine dehydrogenase FAD-binding subunit